MAWPIKKIVTASAFAVSLSAASALAADSDIRVNSVGFLPGYPKIASINVYAGGISALGPFSVKDASSGEIVFSGSADRRVANSDTRDTVLIADFSGLDAPGAYYLEAPGVGKSPNFIIGDNVFVEPYKAAMLGMYLWRCGTAVDATYNGERYQHAACHINDGNLQYIGGGGTRDATGGWHDAGDYNKYVVNSGVSVGLMLKAWEHFGKTLDTIDLIAVNKDGNIPKYLSEVKYNLDWVAKMQYDDGKVSHKLSATGFCGMNVMPENELSTRYFVPYGTPATASFVAMLAQASRIYKPYDPVFADSCLAKAKRSYTFLKQSAHVDPDQTGFSTGGYGVTNDAGIRRWAAIELWETTGDAEYLSDFHGTARAADLGNKIEWANVNGLALLSYLTSEKTGKRQSLADSLTARLISNANALEAATITHGYGRVFGATNYYWGAHGALTATAYVLHTAYSLTGDEKYRKAGHEILSHIFGRNYYGRSFVTGVGHNPPQNPHDRRSSASGKPWPGYLIGGPGHDKSNDNDLRAYACASGTPAAACWKDDAGDYATNEIAINWNASMIYALSGFVYSDGGSSGILRGKKAAAATTPKFKTSKLVRLKNGRAMSDIPVGAKIYGLDGKLIAQRKAGAAAPVIRKNGVFLMRVE
ncbi:MAG: glycoside hydrolase family 9 protein [Chitinispirillales bacterium]|jgi:endoglucanase|nr:glycoside hydrolase family 9 protein [Chitinispirillales bacterium]